MPAEDTASSNLQLPNQSLSRGSVEKMLLLLLMAAKRLALFPVLVIIRFTLNQGPCCKQRAICVPVYPYMIGDMCYAGDSRIT